MNNTNSNLKIGIARENYVYNLLTFKNNWKVYRTNEIVNKYKNIDLICFDSNNNKFFVQVKGIAFYNLMKNKKAKFETITKTINYSIKHNAVLLYAFVEINKNKNLFFMKRVNYEQKWWY